MITLQKTFSFGKIAYYGKARINAVEVTVELRQRQDQRMTIDGDTVTNYVEFSASGAIWNGSHTDWVSGGQNLDEITKFVKDPTFLKIHTLWKRWHLNGLHAGTRAQEAAIAKARAQNDIPEVRGLSDYKWRCAVLEDAGLYTVEIGNPTVNADSRQTYKYGSAWLIELMPDDVVEEVISLLEPTASELEQWRGEWVPV